MPLSTSVTSELDSLLASFTAGDIPRLPGSFVSVVTTESATDVPHQSYLSAAGRRDITVPVEQDSRGSVNPQTYLYMASCTKSLIAVTVLQLIQEGIIPDGLDGTETIAKHIPEILSNGVINLQDGSISPVTEPLTLRHLISHTSGSSYPFIDTPLMKWASERSIPNAFMLTEDSFITLPLVAQPGDTYAYGYGLDWAALLIRRLCGKSVEEVLRERSFEPLGMHRTSFSSQRLVRQVEGDEHAQNLFESKNGMQLHFREPDGRLVLCGGSASHYPRPLGTTFTDGEPPFESGGAGAYSTIEDYSKWLGYLLTLTQAARHPQVLDRLAPTLQLSPELAREFTTPYLDTAQKAGLESLLREEGVTQPEGGDYSRLSHTPALGYYEVPSEHGNPPGTLFWSGVANLFYAIDQGSHDRNPSAIMVATQILPYRDPEWKQLLYGVTRAVFGQRAAQ